jgi:hypothetical protein
MSDPAALRPNHTRYVHHGNEIVVGETAAAVSTDINLRAAFPRF